jgi:hypothetical protein
MVNFTGGVKLKVIIQEQTDELGDEFLDEEEVTADIGLNRDDITMKVDNVLCIIPLAIINGMKSVM